MESIFVAVSINKCKIIVVWNLTRLGVGVIVYPQKAKPERSGDAKLKGSRYLHAMTASCHRDEDESQRYGQ